MSYAYYGKGTTKAAAYISSDFGDLIDSSGWKDYPSGGGILTAEGWYRVATGTSEETSDYVQVVDGVLTEYFYTSTTTSSTSSTTTSTSTTTTDATTSTTTISSYGLRFQYNWNGHKLEIWDKEFIGDALELDALGLPPFTLAIESEDNTIVSPVFKTIATIPIIDTNQFDYDIFYTPDATKFKVRYYRDSILEWTGYITPDSFSEALINKSAIILNARDNWGLLNDITIELSRLGKISDFIDECMALISADFTLEDNYSIVYDDTISVLDGVVWLTKDESYGESLIEILRSIGAQIRFIGGNTFSVFNVGNMLGYGKTPYAQEFMFRDRSGLRTIQPAWREAKFTFDYDVNTVHYAGISDSNYSFKETKTVDLMSVDFYNLSGTPWSIGGISIIKPEDWQGDSQNIYLTGHDYTLPPTGKALSYIMSIPVLTQKMKISFNAYNLLLKYRRMRLGPDILTDHLINFNYTLKLRCNVFFFTATKTYILGSFWQEWDDVDSYIEFNLSTGGHGKIPDGGTVFRPEELSQKDEEFTIEIAGIEEEGTLALTFYPWEASTTINTDYVLRISNLRIETTAPEVEGESYTVINENYNVTQTTAFKHGCVPLYKGNAIAFKGGIFKAGGYYDPVDVVQRTDTAYERKLIQVAGDEILHNFSKQKNILTGTIRSDSYFDLSKMFLWKSKYYALKSGSIDYSKNEMQVELVEVEEFSDPTTTTTSTSTTSTSSTTSTTTAIVYTKAYLAYGVLGTTAEGLASTIINWYASTVNLYSPNNSAWYYDTSYSSLVNGMFVINIDTEYYGWFEIENGLINDLGTKLKSALTTTTSTTTIISRTAQEFWGFDSSTKADAYTSGIESSIYLDVNTKYYTSPTGSTYANGWYLITDNGTEDSSIFWHIVDGVVTEITTTTTTSTTTTSTSTTTTTAAIYTKDYLAYDVLLTPYGTVAATVTDWDATPSKLYSSDNSTWYFDAAYTNLASGMFVDNLSTESYIWFEVTSGSVSDSGESLKTTTTTSTTTSTTTVESRVEHTYPGYSSISSTEAYLSGAERTIWYQSSNDKYYSTSDGTSYASDGWYLVTDNGTAGSSEYLQLSSGSEI